MLQVDLNVPNQQIELDVRKRCFEIGGVISVRVHRSPTAFALIEMSQSEETCELAAQFGGSTFGTCALIHLQQPPQ